MIRILLSLLCLFMVVSCTISEQNPDFAGRLIGTYSTTQIDLNRQGTAYEGGIFNASDGQIAITRTGSRLDQINISFSYTMTREGTTLTSRHTDTETIQLEIVGDQIRFKGVSLANLGWYLGSWSDQNGKISGRYGDKSFVAVKR